MQFILTFCEIQGALVPSLLCYGAESELTSSERNGNWKCRLSETFIRKDRIPGTVPRSLYLEYFKIFAESSMNGINFNVQRTPEITFFSSVRQIVEREDKYHKVI